MNTQPLSLSRTPSVPAARGPARSLNEALTQAETTALHLKTANQSTEQSAETLDGFQASATDIQRDTPWRDVSASGRELHERTDATGEQAQSAVDSQFSALGSLDGAITALDQALHELPAQLREEALEARHHLDQREQIQRSNLELSYGLGAIYGGALPYIESAEHDLPGQDQSLIGNEIYGNLNESLAHLEIAGNVGSGSLANLSEAIGLLRGLRDRLPKPE